MVLRDAGGESKRELYFEMSSMHAFFHLVPLFCPLIQVKRSVSFTILILSPVSTLQQYSRKSAQRLWVSQTV